MRSISVTPCSSDESKSSWKMSFAILTSAWVGPPAANSILKFSISLVMKLKTFYDILNIFRHFIIKVFWIMSSSSSSCLISLTLSRHFSLSFIASSRSSGQHPVSSHSCWMYVRAGRPAFARPCVGVHNNTSLMSWSLLLQQCPACLVRLTWILFVIEGRWPYSWCLVGCCRQDLFKIARSILV